ncbi:MAG: tRNA (guanosine(37)-N1)-methyltransferase TrmD [Patescibacteria group bacterium]
MKRFDIISIFPNSLDSYFNESILARAQKKKLISIKTHDLRKWARDKHRKVDDKPYGGGAGMVIKIEPVYRVLHALRALRIKNQESRIKKVRVILLAANGKQFTQKDAVRLTKYERVIFICGRYEGVDARVEKFVHEKISIGPYVVTGGELPAAMIIDAVARMIPGVVGKEESIQNESFSAISHLPLASSYLEHPHYTRPEIFEVGRKKLAVPKVLLGGNHKMIQAWRKRKTKHAGISL